MCVCNISLLSSLINFRSEAAGGGWGGGPQSMGSKGILHTMPPSAGRGCFPVSNLHNQGDKVSEAFPFQRVFVWGGGGVNCISWGLAVIC